jgi:hypothetical protein
MALHCGQRLLGVALKDQADARRLRVLDFDVFFLGTAIAQTLLDRPVSVPAPRHGTYLAQRMYHGTSPSRLVLGGGGHPTRA